MTAKARDRLGRLAAELRALVGEGERLQNGGPQLSRYALAADAANAIEGYLAGSHKSLDHAFGLVAPVGRGRKTADELSGRELKNYEIAKEIFWLRWSGKTFDEIDQHFDPDGGAPDWKRRERERVFYQYEDRIVAELISSGVSGANSAE